MWEDDEVWKRIVAALIVVLAGAYVFADAWDLAPGPLTTKPEPAEPLPYPTLAQVSAQPPDVVEPDAPAPTADAVNGVISALANAETNTGQTSVVVMDPKTGKVIASRDSSRAATPASNMKLVTARAALDALGPETTLPTRATLSGNTLYLIGGGDVLLAEGAGDPTAIRGRAGLGELAADVADALTRRTDVTQPLELVVDSSLFEGPLYYDDIEGADRGYVMELRPIAVDRGRVQGRGYLADPDLLAGEAFAAQLRGAGVEVGEARRGSAPDDAAELGRVESAPVRDLVDLLLTESDNSVAEVMGHLVAIAKGKRATFAGSSQAISEVLTGAGYPMGGVVLTDASGLSVSNRVTADLLSAILLDVWQCQECSLAGLPAGLPVAALDGTLAERFAGSEAEGQVRAKTGTLVTAISLSGYLRTESGYPLIFSILLDQLEEGTATVSRALIDTFVAGLTKL